MKKIGTISLLILIALGIYFFSSKKEMPILLQAKKPTQEIQEQAPEIDPVPKSLETNLEGNKARPKSEVADEKDFEDFDRMEENWINQMKTFFNDDKKFNIYMMFRDNCEKEKLDAYEDYHKHLEAKYGKNYSYSLSEDDTKREESINNKYLNKIKMLLGEKDYIKYLEIKDQFNKDEARKMTNKKNLLIEI